MHEATPRTPSKLDPGTVWTIVTDAPLKGLSLAREPGTLLAWDESDGLYLLDPSGDVVATARAPGRIVAGAISDNGALVALIGEGSRLWLLGYDLELLHDRGTIPEASSLAVDPHGRYLAVASRVGLNQLYSRHGKQAGRFETRQPLAHLAFVPTQPLLIGSAAHGTLAGIELDPRANDGRLEPEVAWQANLLSNVGRLALSGDGGMLLTACYAHGVQRYDLRGRNEGAYHLGGSASHAVPDFAGRTIAVATLEGELAVLGPAGNVRWRTNLPRPALGLEIDALGRSLIYGLATGEITRVDLHGGSRRKVTQTQRQPTDETAAVSVAARPAGGGSVLTPAWTLTPVTSDEQAEFAVLTVLDDPPRVGMITSTNRLHIYSTEGRLIGQAPDIGGVGRILRASPGWIAASTDRQIMLCDVRRNLARRLDLNLVEVTHLAIRPDTHGLAIVQERDRVGRATAAGRWVWRKELRSAVEDLAIGPDGLTGVTTDDGGFTILDPSGEVFQAIEAGRGEPLSLLSAPEGSPAGMAWLTLARRDQVLRGHDRDGRILWETPVPWEAWQFLPLEHLAIVVAADGRFAAFDATGRLRNQSREAGDSQSVFSLSGAGEVIRIHRQGVHLICSDASGRVAWRAVSDAQLGPVAAGRSGVAAFFGRQLVWFPAQISSEP